jgi:uncharacterized membrane protein
MMGRRRLPSTGMAAGVAAPASLPRPVSRTGIIHLKSPALRPASTEPGLTRLARALGLAGLEGASVALAVWTVRASPVMPAFVRANELEPDVRTRELVHIAVGVLTAVVVAAAVLARKRREGLDLVERVVRLLSPLALLGPAALLLDWRLWPEREPVFYALVLGAGLCLSASLVAASRAGPLRSLAPLRTRFGDAYRAMVRRAPRAIDTPLVAVLLGASLYTAYFSIVTIDNHRNLGTSIDLAIEDNLMWNLVHGGPLFRSTPFSGPTGSHFGHHATFFSYLLAPIYALAPRPETLLVVQAVLLGGGAVPLFLYARRHVAPWIAAVVAFAYLAYPPLHGANLYDYHYLPLGIPFLWWVLYAVESRRRVMALVIAIVAMSIREDVAGQLAVLGVFLLLTGPAAVEGVLLTVVPAAYAVALKLYVMPMFKGGEEAFVNQYEGMLPSGAHGFEGVLSTIVGNPAFSANVVLEKDKFGYALQIFAPLLALPLRAPRWWLLVLPGFAFTLLSTAYTPLIQISFQYSAYWIPWLFIGVVLALEKIGATRAADDVAAAVRQRAAVAGLVFASMASTLYQGAFTRHETVRAGFGRFHFGTTADDLRRRAELTAALDVIPRDARVAASEELTPHASSRTYDYKLRYGIWDAEYLLFTVPVGGEEGKNALPPIRSGEFGVLADLGHVVVARRGEPTTRNASFLGRIGR